jgi:hypothetical protein
VSTLIDALPGVAAIDKEIAELAALEQKYISGHAAQVDEYIAAAAMHDAAVSDALESGKLPPDRPTEPPSDAEHQDRLVIFRNRHSMLQERRLAAISASASTIELKTSAAYADLIDQAGRPVATLKRIAADIAVLLDTRHEAACAVVAVDPSRGSGASRPPSPPKVDAEAVVAAVTRRVDLLAVEVDRRLGMSSNLHEMVAPTRNLEPKPGQRSVQRTHSSLGMVQPYGPGR